MTENYYEDGIDKPLLRFEKTQNRDIIQTIERINRAEKFRPSANDIISLIKPILTKEVKKIIFGHWRNKHSSHSDPEGFALTVDIIPPVLKKVHPEGDTDKVFKMHKEYPFYYLMNILISAKFKPSENDEMGDDEAWYSNWFIQNISPSLNNDVLEKIKSALATKFNNVFFFPSIDKNDLDGKTESGDIDANKITIENSSIRLLNRINLITTTVLKFNKEDISDEVTIPFDYNDDTRHVLSGNIAMALERIIRV